MALIPVNSAMEPQRFLSAARSRTAIDVHRRIALTRAVYDELGAPTLEQLRRELEARHHLVASIRTLRRYLLVDGVRYVRRSFPREALQKLAAREKWARAMTYAGGKWYKRMIFSDEKLFVMDPNYQGSRVVWLRQEEDPRRLHHRSRNQSIKIMVFGVFGYDAGGNGCGDLCIVPHASDGSVTGEVYCDVLNEFVAPFMAGLSRQKVLLEDNASPHRACGHIPMPFYRVTHGSYPAHSPDFNAIERIWAMMDTTINEKLQHRPIELRRDVTYIRKLLAKTFRKLVKGPGALRAWQATYRNLASAAANGGHGRPTGH